VTELRVRGIDTYYGRTHALRDVSLHVADGESVAVLGANGAGKTTLLRSICGATPPRRGAITYGTVDLVGLSPSRILRHGISYVPEGRGIFTRMSVKENLLLGASARSDHQAVADDLEQLLTLFPIMRDKLRALGGSLSGGQQTVLRVARALMARPALLLLDEPSLGLAPLLVDQLSDHLRTVRKTYGTAVVLVEQNVGLALEIADRSYVLQNGKVVHEGSRESLLGNEVLWRAYLGGAAPAEVTADAKGASNE